MNGYHAPRKHLAGFNDFRQTVGGPFILMANWSGRSRRFNYRRQMNNIMFAFSN